MFVNPPAGEIARLLRSARTIAVVGLSADRTRPSHGVARALQRFGYRIIPVNPALESVLPNSRLSVGLVYGCRP